MARIKHGTLAANTVTTVAINQNVGSLEVLIVANPAAIYFRTDGTNPTVGGDDCEVVPAAVGAALSVDTPEHFSLRLISTGTPTYCVRGL